MQFRCGIIACGLSELKPSDGCEVHESKSVWYPTMRVRKLEPSESCLAHRGNSDVGSEHEVELSGAA